MKVAILGTVPASRQLAPFDDPEWKIWVCSPGNRGGACPRVDTWFELHGIEDLKGPENRPWLGEYVGWLRSQPFPIYMQEPNDLVPQATVFPIKMLLEEFYPLARVAFTSSISMMIAYAIHQGATEIGVYGVDMAADTEAYTGQKSGCQIMMALAHMRGIKVTVPLDSCLAALPPLYGYAEASRMGRRLLVRENEIRQSIGDIQNTITRLTGDLHYHRGALEDLSYVRRTFVDGEDDAELDEQPKVENIKVSADGAMVQPAFGPYVLDKASGVLVPKKGNGLAREGAE